MLGLLSYYNTDKARFWQNEAKSSNDFKRAYGKLSKEKDEGGASTDSGDRRRATGQGRAGCWMA
jgi:hypothetical protein